jgi:hypothetical protein
MKIKSARITAMPRPMPEGMFDEMPQVYVTMEDGTNAWLFEFYPDEISFKAEEFIGLTVDEAHALKTKKDIKFIQS